MKNRRLWISFVFVLLAGLSGRLAWVFIQETAGVILMIISASCVVVALTIFAIYFRE